MIRTFLIALSIILFSSPAIGKEYGNYEPKRILTVSESPSGKKYGLDRKYLDQILADLSLHAKNYPPQFDTPQDRQRAVQNIKDLSGMMDILVNGANPNPQFLWRAGSLNSMGHNLDISGSARKASAIFQKLLDIVPSDPHGNYMYGTLLAGTGKPKEALPYLEKALSVGVSNASYAIGMVYLTLGDKQKAIENLEAYQKRNPGDSNATKLLHGLRNGKVEIKYESKTGVDSIIISKKALKSFNNKYVNAKLHKAFAQSQSGAWNWKSNRTSVEHAKTSALIGCQRNNQKNETLYPCKIINVDNKWIE